MEVWLRDESDDSRHFLESEGGSFTLSGITPFTTMIVEGPLVSGFPPRVQSTRGHLPAMASSSSVRVASATPPRPIYCCVVAPKKVTITVKIVKARMKMPKKDPEILSSSPSAKCMWNSLRPQRTLHMSQTWFASSGGQNTILYQRKA